MTERMPRSRSERKNGRHERLPKIDSSCCTCTTSGRTIARHVGQRGGSASCEKSATRSRQSHRVHLSACTSPKRYRNLKDGKHRMFVLATDPAGNEDDKAAKAKFRIP